MPQVLVTQMIRVERAHARVREVSAGNASTERLG